MKRNDVLTALKSLEPKLRAHGIDGLYLYGSFARDEADAHSDIDIFVDALHPKFYTLGPFVGAYEEIRRALPEREIGYATRNGLSPHIRALVEAEAIKVF